MPRYSLFLFKSPSEGAEITSLTESVKWKGRKGSSCRTISVKIADDTERAGIDVEKGHHVILKYDGQELFRGLIMNMNQTDDKTLSFTAYDMGIYLANNKDTFTYADKTADEIFGDVCRRFGLPIGRVDKCSYRIPELSKPNTTAWDVLADAMSLDFDNTHTRHFITAANGKLSLTERKKSILQWLLEAGENLYDYSFSRSIEKISTRVKLLSDENTVAAEEKDSELEKRIGIFQTIDKPDETLNAAQITQLAKTQLREKSRPEKTLTVSTIGNPEIISGVGVYVRIPHFSIAQTYYVDEDTHTFEGENYKLNLKLNYTDNT